MSVKQTRVSLKDMSDEEKKERKRVMMREYMAKRREDPIFADKQREVCRKNMTEKRKDEDFNEKHRHYCMEYNKKKKEKMKSVLPLLQRYFEKCKEYPGCNVSLEGGQIWIKTKEGLYIAENKETKSFVERLNQVILQNDERSRVVSFSFGSDEIEIITKEGFSLYC